MRANWLVWTAAASAFSDTSPFLLISSDKILETSEYVSELPLNEALSSVVASNSQSCMYDTYVFASIPDVTEKLFTAKNLPNLDNIIAHAEDTYLAPTTSGEITPAEIAELQRSLASSCDLKLQNWVAGEPNLFEKSVVNMDLGNMDSKSIDVVFSTLDASSNNYLLAITSSVKNRGSKPKAVKSEDSEDSEEPETEYSSLFKNYQFFSPALFMGLIVSGLLIFVFLIAFKSVNSLQISTAAFTPSTDTRKQQ